MRIFVCIKQVPDTETKIKINADGSGIDTAGIKWVMNPYDEFAVEEALKLKTANAGSTVTIVSLGPKTRVVDSIRTGLAMGADDGLLIEAPENLDNNSTAKALAAAIKQEDSFGIVFTGKLAIDDNSAATSQLLAEYLEIPHTTVVSKFEFSGDKATVEREVEGGAKEVVEMTIPAVIGANKGLNMPRYASLPGIMKAKKKPLKEVTFDSLGIDANQMKYKFSDFQLPPEKPPIKMIDGDEGQQSQELVRLLREEAKVI